MKNVIFLDFKKKCRVKKLKKVENFQDFFREVENTQFALMRAKTTEEILELEKKLTSLTREGEKKFNLSTENKVGEI